MDELTSADVLLLLQAVESLVVESRELVAAGFPPLYESISVKE